MQTDIRNYDTEALSPAEGDRFNQVIVLSQGGDLQRACEEGRLFIAANQAAVTTSTTLNTAFTGLAVSNPAGSGKNLIFHEFGWAQSVAGGGDGVVSLATTTSSGIGAAITQRSRKFGTGTSVALVDDAATIVAPVIEQQCGTHATGNTNTGISVVPGIVDLQGSLILVPGRAVVTNTTTATSALFYFLWEEVPA